MAEAEKLLSGSPFTATGVASAGPADITTARLISTGGPCTVTLYDGTIDVFTLNADIGRPDAYKGTANRKLTFRTDVEINFVSGTGKLYLYFT